MFKFKVCSNLKSAVKVTEALFCLGSRSSAITLLPKSSKGVGGLNILEESSGLCLLCRGSSSTTHSSTSLIHVTSKLILHIEPFLAINVGRELIQTIQTLRNNGLTTNTIFRTSRLVKGFVSSLTIDRVRRVHLGALIGSVRGTLRVGVSFSNQTKHGESRRFTGSCVGDERGGNSGSTGNLGKGSTTRVLIIMKKKKKKKKTNMNHSTSMHLSFLMYLHMYIHSLIHLELHGKTQTYSISLTQYSQTNKHTLTPQSSSSST